MVTYKIDLDITPGGIPKVVHVKQYQTDATLEFKLHTRRGIFNVGNVTDCSIRGTKTDGNGYSASASFTVSSSTVKVDLTEQMTAVSGRQPYEITLTDGSGKMITATFYLDVQRAALDGETISASDIREITNALDHSDEIIAAYNQSTYDDIPTANSNHAVKSGGIKTAIDNVTASLAETNINVADVTGTLSDTRGLLTSDWEELSWRKSGDNSINSQSPGEEMSSSVFCSTNYILVKGIKRIQYTRVASTSNIGNGGMSFYNENLEWVDGKAGLSNQTSNSYVTDEISVPANAVYARFTYRKDTTTYGNFSISGILVPQSIDSILTERVTLPHCFFVYHRIMSQSGSVSDNNRGAYTRVAFRMEQPFKISFGNNCYMQTYDPNTGKGSLIHNDYFANYFYGYLSIYTKTSSQALTASDIDNIEIYTTKEGKAIFTNTYAIKIDHTQVLEEDDLAAYALGTLTDNLGMLIPGNSKHRSSFIPYISEFDLDLYCGQYGTNQINVIVNDQVINLTNGLKCGISANTPFMIDCFTTATNPSPAYNFVVVHTDNKPDTFTRVLSSSTCSRADASVMTPDDKCFMVSYYNGGTFSVKQGNTFILSNVSLDHDPGHCNTGNYSDGNFYVSYWTAPQNNGVAVYNIDSTNNTLTYEKELLFPITEEFENTGYHVFDEEKQVFFLGWGMLNGSERDSFVYGLYIKANDTYKLAWKRYAKRVENILQGFTVQGNYIYMAESAMNYHFIGLRRINMATGALEYSSTVLPDGSLSTSEVESVIPVEKEQFILTDRNGKVYFYVWS